MYDGVTRELQRLSDTRWACRNVMDRLPAILQVLEEISAENNPQRAIEAKNNIGLKRETDKLSQRGFFGRPMVRNT